MGIKKEYMGFSFVHFQAAGLLEGVQRAFDHPCLSDRGHSHQHGIVHKLLMGLRGHSYMRTYPVDISHCFSGLEGSPQSFIQQDK